MAFEFKLPDVGEGLHEAELLKWMVKVGDEVQEDQPLLEVQTDKASVEITAPVKGKVTKLIGNVGDILNVGSVVVIFDDGTTSALPTAPEVASATAAAAPAGAGPKVEANVTQPAAEAPGKAPAVPAVGTGPVAMPTAPAAPAGGAVPPGYRALATPATRKLARDLNLDINQIPGTGPAGRVTAEDVRAFAAGGGRAAAAPAPAEAPTGVQPAAPTVTVAPYVPAGASQADERVPLRGIRKVIADRMVKSKQTAPHVTTVDELDMTDLVALREKAKEAAAKRGVKLTFLPFFFKALTVALREFPAFNAQIDDEKQEIVYRKQYHLGFALDTEAGLLVPVVKDADRKTILQIAAEMQDLIERGRKGKLAPDELRGSTFSVSNQGSIGGLFFTPVINHPEVAILGIGQTQERPVVRDGQIVIRKMAYLALSFDHRLIDGALATRFLSRVVELLANPTLLMMEAM